MYKKIILTLLSLNFFGLYSQEVKDSLQPSNYKNAVFIELLGATGYLSINYERKVSFLKNWTINPGIGVGYADETFSSTAPQLVSYILKIDVLYEKSKRIKPVLGYAFSHNFEVGDPHSFRVGCVNNVGFSDGCNEKYTYLVHSLNIGMGVNFLKHLEVVPRYYLLFVKRSDHPDIIFVNWSGVQLKYKF